VDLALLHDAAPIVYQWRASRAVLDAA
jgi:hypothetical protein